MGEKYAICSFKPEKTKKNRKLCTPLFTISKIYF